MLPEKPCLLMKFKKLRKMKKFQVNIYTFIIFASNRKSEKLSLFSVTLTKIFEFQDSFISFFIANEDEKSAQDSEDRRSSTTEDFLDAQGSSSDLTHISETSENRGKQESPEADSESSNNGKKSAKKSMPKRVISKIRKTLQSRIKTSSGNLNITFSQIFAY